VFIVERFKSPPIAAQIKNILEGENLSAIHSIAKIKVPIINPNCKDEVRAPREFGSKWYVEIKSSITLLGANQREVQKN
jgi:hypothetical protein